MARQEGMKVDEDKQPRRRRSGSWEEARVGLLPITGLSQVKIIIFQLFFYVARQTFGPVLHFFHVGSIKNITSMTLTGTKVTLLYACHPKKKTLQRQYY